MPYFVVQKAERILGLQGKSLRGSKILALGVAYKADLPDIRESPALKVIQLLMKEGCEVQYYDPYVPTVEVQLQNQTMHEGQELIRLDSIGKLTTQEVSNVDLVVILTGHSCVDYELVVGSETAVLDTRNATRNVENAVGEVRTL
jgi:UDP-N-acetyl-D-glucosamine dehydrogenase